MNAPAVEGATVYEIECVTRSNTAQKLVTRILRTQCSCFGVLVLQTCKSPRIVCALSDTYIC